MTGFSWLEIISAILILITLILTWKLYLQNKSNELRNSIEDSGEAVLPGDQRVKPVLKNYSPCRNVTVDFRFLEQTSTSRGSVVYYQTVADTTPWASVDANIDKNKVQEIENLGKVRDISPVKDEGWEKLRVIIQSTDVKYVQSKTEKILKIIDRGEW